MTTYKLKRKTFNVISNASKSVLGGTAGTAGNLLDNSGAGLIGGMAGAAALGGTVAQALPGIGTVAGTIAGYAIGKAATRGAGKILKNVGNDIKYS